jgi:ABC-type nickel/cobalt efflux system permease component RcnA
MVIFVMIVGAGFAMVQGESSDKEKSKKTLTSALVGLVIMLAAYWIMQILQLITGIYMGF